MSDYVRTDAELAHQHAYEAREALLHGGSLALIHYRVIEGVPEGDVITRKVGWRVGRKVGESKEVVTDWFYRRVEATDYIKQEMWRDNSAAQRLGMNARVTAGS